MVACLPRIPGAPHSRRIVGLRELRTVWTHATTQPLCVVTSLSGGRSRLLVSRRSAQSGRYRVIGYLDRLAGIGFEFTYLATAIAARRVRRPLRRRYHRSKLFPSFGERTIGLRRPDRREYLASLGLGASAKALGQPASAPDR